MSRPKKERSFRDRPQLAEEALRAIQAGDEHVVTLEGADLPYRILLDQMYAGAVTLTADGVIIYCNHRFADIVRTPKARVVGMDLRRFVPPAEQTTIETMLERGIEDQARGEVDFRAGDGTPVTVGLTFSPLRLAGASGASGVIGVVVDTTERKQQEELRARLVKQVMTAQDEERRRIARELHDETGQSLTALLVGLRTIEESRTMLEAVALAQRLRVIVAQTLGDVGRLARGLHPSILDDLGLAAAVAHQAHDLAEVHGVAVDVRIEGLDAEPLPPLLQTTVYRVLQEALTNVARHAAARSVRVQLVCDEAKVELSVQDDGVGFDSKARADPTPGGRRRLGLRGMRERAALIGGSVDVVSPPGAGTTITAYFPLRSA